MKVRDILFDLVWIGAHASCFGDSCSGAGAWIGAHASWLRAPGLGHGLKPMLRASGLWFGLELMVRVSGIRAPGLRASGDSCSGGSGWIGAHAPWLGAMGLGLCGFFWACGFFGLVALGMGLWVWGFGPLELGAWGMWM